MPLVIPPSKKNPRSRFFFCRNVARYPWLESHYLHSRLGEMYEGLLFRVSGGIKHVYFLKNELKMKYYVIPYGYVYKIYLIIKICICTNETHIHVCTHLSIPLRLKATVCCWCLPPRQPVSCLQVPTSFFLFPRKPAMPSNVPFLP